MTRVRVVRNFAFVLGIAVVSPPLLVGCGGDAANQPVTREVPLSVSAKDSMDFHRQNYMKKGNAPKRGRH